jgi:exopolysaccharide production protein ExoQ
VLVELGFVGFVPLVLVIVRVLFGHLARLLNDRHNQASYIMLGIAVMLLIRSFVEIDVLHPYMVGSFLLYYAAGLLAAPQAAPALAGRVDPRLTQLQHAA